MKINPNLGYNTVHRAINIGHKNQHTNIPFTKQQNFRPAHIESIDRRQIKCNSIHGCEFDTVENIMGKEENAGFQHYLLFPQCFQKSCSSESFKVDIDCMVFNAVFNIISVIPPLLLHLSMFSWISFNQYSA